MTTAIYSPIRSLGLSSLGRSEPYVLATIEAVLGLLAARTDQATHSNWRASPSRKVTNSSQSTPTGCSARLLRSGPPDHGGDAE